MDRLHCSLEVKFLDSSPDGTFSGYGAAFSNVDSYGDVIQPGAFADSLKGWKKAGRLPPMLLQHALGMTTDDELPIGVWTAMEEDDTGLKVEGRLIAMDTDRGKYIYEGLKAKALDGLSIGYQPKEFVMGTKPKEPRRSLKSVELMECSIVTFPANQKARVAAVKSARSIMTIREFETALREDLGFSNAAAKAIAASGFKSSDPRDEDDAMSGLLETIRQVRAGLSA